MYYDTQQTQYYTFVLQVKCIVTPDRVSVVIICVFVALILCGAPAYVVYRLELIFLPVINKTLVSISATQDRDRVESISLAINSFSIPFAAFSVIVVCTIILSVSLQRGTRWRKSVTRTSHKDSSHRNLKVIKMVVMVSTLFIICFVPISTNMLIVAFKPELNIYGRYWNVGLVMAGVGLFLESINSSANIFIYYHMSGKYRNTFRHLFCMDKLRQNPKSS